MVAFTCITDSRKDSLIKYAETMGTEVVEKKKIHLISTKRHEAY